MSEEKKLPITVEQAKALDAAIVKELESSPQVAQDDQTLPEEFKDRSKLSALVEAKLGKPVKALAYGPLGEMLHEGAAEYLKEHEPLLWARLQKDKFGT